MTARGKYIFIASMDIDPAKEDLFNEVYDTEHVPTLLKVPGVFSVKRYVNLPVTVVIGGEKKTLAHEGEPKHCAIYEIESPDVLTSEAWSKAVDAGRWPNEVRPYTYNRKHMLRELIAES